MRRAYIQLHISVLLWGFTGVFGRAIDLKEVILVWYRLAITVTVLLAINYFNKKVSRLSPREILKISKVGFLVALHWVLFYGSIKYSNISVALCCLSTVAVFTSIFEPVMTGRKINSSEFLLALTAAVGVYIIFSFQEFHRTGIILGIGAAIVGSIFTILNSRLTKEYNSETITAYELGTGLIYLTLFMPVYIHIFQPEVLIPEAKDWGLLLLFSIVCTVIPFNLSIKALEHLSAFTSTLTVNLEPLYGISLAFLFFHEQNELKSGFYIGALLILSSVVLYMFIRHRHNIRNLAKMKLGKR